MSYILRNGLHHGVAPIPFAYPHCSVNAIFQREMGKRSEQNLLPAKSFYRFIGRNSDVPDNYRMSASGLFLRESVLDIPQVGEDEINPINFKELTAKYPDAYAWIRIPGTNVDYPIVQHESDNEYYLKHMELLPEDLLSLMERENVPKEIIVCDHVAGMSDRFAISTYEDIYIPKNWHG